MKKAIAAGIVLIIVGIIVSLYLLWVIALPMIVIGVLIIVKMKTERKLSGQSDVSKITESVRPIGKGLLAGGIALIIVGIIISAVSSSAQSYTTRGVSECDSFGGQFKQWFDKQTRQNCANAVTYQSASSGGIMLGWGVVALGVVLAGVGGFQMARSSSRNLKAPRYLEPETSVGTVASTSTFTQGKIFCRYCGKLRPVSGTYCSECTKPTVSAIGEVKECSFCSASMSADSEFCANCGRKF